MINNIRRDILYSDFRTDFEPHPVKKDVVLLTNENSILRSIKNIILTNPGERFFSPNFGGGINRLLFEDISNVTEYRIRNKIIECIENYEPRANIIEVYVTTTQDEHTYSITIIFSIINREEPITATFLLNRIR
jgi:phage baseplate assembly protein W